MELMNGIKALQEDSKETITQTLRELAEKDNDIRAMRSAIVSASKQNFVLERQLAELDEKIKLLIKNRIDVEEAQKVLEKQDGSNDDDEKGLVLGDNRGFYEDLYRELQANPVYFAKLARMVEAKHIGIFVQTVVFDMYGDQYATREERLLLLCFHQALKDEISSATSKGSLFRANTAITQMLSAYALRGQGLATLRSILEDPLKMITSQKHLNLEINPSKVYVQMIQDSETETGQASPLPHSVSDEQAAANPDVRKLIGSRVVELLKLTELILTRIIKGVENVPYGMRWICKQLGKLCKAKFPETDKYQIGSLMGGYIYLRFFNPVIVTPDALNFIQTKPTRIKRRNLILIAKVLQNLSNGLAFGDKEQYMMVANHFIKDKQNELQQYFEQLAAVDDLQDSLQVDKYLEHTQMSHIKMNLRQVYLCHRLIVQNLPQLCPAEEPGHEALRKMIQNYGSGIPPVITTQNDHAVVLHLGNKHRQKWVSTSELDSDQLFGERRTTLRGAALKSQAKDLVLAVLSSLTTEQVQASAGCHLMPFLAEQSARASKAGDTIVAQQLNHLRTILVNLHKSGLLEPKGPTGSEEEQEATMDGFLACFVVEVQQLNERLRQIHKRLEMIKGACDSISAHHEYLVSRLDLYRLYLDNVRKGGSSQVVRKKKNNKEDKRRCLRFMFATLEQEGVIDKVKEASVSKKLMKKVGFKFTEEAPSKFKVEVSIKKGVEINLLDKPLEFTLDELLEMRSKNQNYLDFDPVTLNVNILVRFLNLNFIKK